MNRQVNPFLVIQEAEQLPHPLAGDQDSLANRKPHEEEGFLGYGQAVAVGGHQAQDKQRPAREPGGNMTLGTWWP